LLSEKEFENMLFVISESSMNLLYNLSSLLFKDFKLFVAGNSQLVKNVRILVVVDRPTQYEV